MENGEEFSIKLAYDNYDLVSKHSNNRSFILTIKEIISNGPKLSIFQSISHSDTVVDQFIKETTKDPVVEFPTNIVPGKIILFGTNFLVPYPYL